MRWDRDAGVKERPRVVTSTWQDKETKEVTDAQVKEAAGRSSNKLNDSENKTRRNEDLKGKRGGRLKLCNVDGDVPLCMRSIDEENKDNSSSSSSKKDNKDKMVSGSSVSDSRKKGSRSKMTTGSKAMQLKKKNQESGKNTRKRHHIHRAAKNVRSIRSSERIEEMVCEVNERNFEARQVRNLGNTPETHVHGSRQI